MVNFAFNYNHGILRCRVTFWNGFIDVENVIKQFEFLEDELEQNMNDKDKSTSDINLHQTYKEEGTSRTTPCKDDKMVEEEKEEGADFGDQIMRQLETFQNSVNEVNNLFYLDPNPRNSGIFYAELVYAHWLLYNCQLNANKLKIWLQFEEA